MTNKPSWQVHAPWDVQLPTTVPLTKDDLREHGELLPGMGPRDPQPLVRVGATTRCALAYLIPQSTGLTGRLVLCWAFKAPLIALRDITAELPMDQAIAASARYRAQELRPDLDAIVAAIPLIELELAYLFTQVTHLPDGEHALVRINPLKVVVAPVDTPVHAYSSHLASFPGN